MKSPSKSFRIFYNPSTGQFIRDEIYHPRVSKVVEVKIETPKKVVEEKPFIAFDLCGWNDQYGRFTHCPSGDTLACKGWMGQSDWNKAQLEWFKKYPLDIVVHRCLTGAYRETGDTMGSIGEIINRLKNRI